ncbi:MAG: hypothetical protein PVI50_03025 [Gammaproteobacteria bacterium]|jgi:hypothetical protein
MRLVWTLAILAAAAGFWLYTHPESGAELQSLLLRGGANPGTDRLYKWRNEHGDWQVTDSLPPSGTAYETLDFRADVNVLPVPPQLERDR